MPARVPAGAKDLVLKTVDDAVAGGSSHRWATSLWGVSDNRVHRWRTRRRELGTLEDLAPGGARCTPCWPTRSPPQVEQLG